MNKINEYFSHLDKNLKFTTNAIVDGFITGLHQSPYHGFSVEFSEHKAYSESDPVSLIDWKIFSKTDRYYVKRFEEETNVRTYFLLDISKSMSYESNGMTKIEYAKYMTACLINLSLRQRDATGLTLFNEKIIHSLPAKSRTTWLNQCLHILENIQCTGETNIADSLLELNKKIHKRSLIVIITDGFDEPEKFQKVLNYLKFNLHHCIIFHIADPKELNFNFNEEADFIDLETNELLKISPSLLRNEYLKKLEMFHVKHKEIIQKLKYDYLIINTSTPIERILKKFLTSKTRKINSK